MNPISSKAAFISGGMTEPLIAELETSLRERFALSEHPARIAGRDRKISALRALKDGKDDA